MYGPLPPTVSGLALPFIYPPFAAMVLLPLEVLPWTAAWIALYALSVGQPRGHALRRGPPGLAGGRAGGRAVRRVAPRCRWLLLDEPVLETFKFGQVNLVLMALVAVDCLAPRTRWPRGLLVGVAAAIKLTPAAFVLFFLLRGDRRAAVVTVVTAAAATGLGFAVDAASSARYWFGGPAAGVSGSVFYTNQTVQAVLARAEVPALAAKAVWLVAAVGAARADRPGGAPRRARARAGDRRRVRAAGQPDVVVAPLGVDRAGAAGGRRAGGPAGSRGWAAAAAVLAVTFYIAPFRWLPHEHEQELAWTAAQQVVGATYVIVGSSRWWRCGWRPPRAERAAVGAS